MAARKATQKDNKVEYKRVDIDDAIVEDLPEEDIWNDLVTENPVPDMVVKGVRIPQPTKKQVDFWRTCPDPVQGEKVLFGEDNYAKLQELFDDLPQSAWSNFNRRFLIHMFGMADGAALKG